MIRLIKPLNAVVLHLLPKCGINLSRKLLCDAQYLVRHQGHFKYYFFTGILILISAIPIQCVLDYFSSNESLIDRMGAVALSFFIVSEVVLNRQTSEYSQSLQAAKLQEIYIHLTKIHQISNILIPHSIDLKVELNALSMVLAGKWSSKAKKQYDAVKTVCAAADLSKKLIDILQNNAAEITTLEKEMNLLKENFDQYINHKTSENSHEELIEQIGNMTRLFNQLNKFGSVDLKSIEQQIKQDEQQALLAREAYLHNINTVCIIISTILWGFGSLFVT